LTPPGIFRYRFDHTFDRGNRFFECVRRTDHRGGRRLEYLGGHLKLDRGHLRQHSGVPASANTVGERVKGTGDGPLRGHQVPHDRGKVLGGASGEPSSAAAASSAAHVRKWAATTVTGSIRKILPPLTRVAGATPQSHSRSGGRVQDRGFDGMPPGLVQLARARRHGERVDHSAAERRHLRPSDLGLAAAQRPGDPEE
jgi:hypothetical protein